jgi:hypothetical protein
MLSFSGTPVFLMVDLGESEYDRIAVLCKYGNTAEEFLNKMHEFLDELSNYKLFNRTPCIMKFGVCSTCYSIQFNSYKAIT